MGERLIGRVAASPIAHLETGELIVDRDEEIAVRAVQVVGSQVLYKRGNVWYSFDVARQDAAKVAADAKVIKLEVNYRSVHEILERVGIAEKLYERTDRLSGGQRQRVAIARALYQDPAALLPDEPISSLDPARSRDTLGLLMKISREEGLTLCASLHDLALAREFLPRLVGLRHGKVAFDRATAELDDADFHGLYDLAPEELAG